MRINKRRPGKGETVLLRGRLRHNPANNPNTTNHMQSVQSQASYRQRLTAEPRTREEEDAVPPDNGAVAAAKA